MSHRDPRRPIGSEPEDSGQDPDERPLRSRRSDPSLPPGSTVGRSSATSSTSFPWLDVDPSSPRSDDRGDGESLVRARRAEPGQSPETRRPPTARGSATPAAATNDPTDPAAWSEVTEDWAASTDQGWEDHEVPVVNPRPAPTRRRARAAVTSRDRSPSRPAVTVPALRIPTFVTGSDLVGDRTTLVLLGAGLVSLAAMAIVLATQLPDLAPSLVTHLDPAGMPDRWGPPRVLWRLPLLVGTITLVNLVIAWVASRYDRFAGRFILAAALVAQIIVWVAIFDFLG